MPRPGGRPSRQYLEDTKRMQEKRKLKEVGMLTGGQAKIAAKAPPPNKIDEKDFAVLRAEKAKGRGMGLQDEKVKPGKVMKAKRGKAIEKLAKKKGLPLPLTSSIPGGTKKGFFKAFGQFPAVPSKGKSALTAKGTSKNFKGYSKVFEGPQNKGRVATISGVKPTLPKPSKESSLARRALRGVKATRLGKIVLPIAAAGVAAEQYLKSKMKKKKEEPKKKMGGGMMKRPMGYTKGGGADTGRIGELKSKIGVLSNKLKRRGPGTGIPTSADMKKIKERLSPENLKQAGRTGAVKLVERSMKILKDNKKMGGGMMMKPMGYKSGKSIKVKCKLGKNKPTKMY